MSTLWKDIRYKMLHSGSKLGLLIGINMIVFLAINIPAVFEQLFRGFGNSAIANVAYSYLAMPSSLPKLLTHPWTPITYMFMHDGVFHVLFNMLWLYWFGQIFEEYLGNKRTLTLYFLGGLAGAIFFVGSFNIFPGFANSGILGGATIVGASACVMAIIVATATLLPDYEIFLMFLGPVKLKWLALFFVIIDFLNVASANAGGELAHLGGALIGFIYIKQLKRGRDWSAPINNIFTAKSKIKVVAGGGGADGKKASLPRQDEVDRILDKISQSGYDSLNKQEKETLFRASNNER
ncbi:MAG: rhomboid family intramembrane serine protease [Bacteroidota bacterium]